MRQVCEQCCKSVCVEAGGRVVPGLPEDLRSFQRRAARRLGARLRQRGQEVALTDDAAMASAYGHCVVLECGALGSASEDAR